MDAREQHLEQLAGEARHAEQKLALYRAKRYGGRTINETRMRELERQAQQTAERLAAARTATP